MATVWLVPYGNQYHELENALSSRGVQVHRISDESLKTATHLFGARGLLLVDVQHPLVDTIIVQGSALLPVLLLGSKASDLAKHATMVTDVTNLPQATARIMDLLTERDNQRRYPRASVDLRVRVEGHQARLNDISMYGVFITPDPGYDNGQTIECIVQVDDGAEINLEGTVVGHRDEGIAVRCKPKRDQDLLLWLNLLMGELIKDPRYADIDPFGPLFR